MNSFRWLIRTLWFSRWITLGIVLASAVSTAVLSGSLLTGDSVHQSLQMQMHQRLGRTKVLLAGDDVFFRPALADDIAKQCNTQVAAVIVLTGWAENSDGTRRVNRVNIYGVDAPLAKLNSDGELPWTDKLQSGVVINNALAQRLNAGAGDSVVFALQTRGGLAADSVLFPDTRLQQSRRMAVAAVASDTELGPLSFFADTAAAMNIFVSRQQLAGWIGQKQKANAILIGSGADLVQIKAAVIQSMQPEDLALEVHKPNGLNVVEVRSHHVFIKDAVGRSLLHADPSAVGVLSYFVNEIRCKNHAVPYSVVSSFGSPDMIRPNLYTLLADDEIILNEWTASDLRADAGDTITLRYFTAGSKAEGLIEQTVSFRVRAVVPMMGTGADPTLMPEFPELADVQNCRDWDPGVPIDLSKIRDRDEAYWDRYRGSPKAFVSLPAAQRMWGGRFGSLTAVRYDSDVSERKIAHALRAGLDPSDGGLAILDVGTQAKRSAAGMTDFGSLFAGLSMFLVLSAVILSGMIFYYGMERQSRQIGMLKATGFTTFRIRTMYLGYGLICAIAGSLAGILIAIGYTKLVIDALRSMWSGAIANASVELFIDSKPLFMGAVIAILSAAVAILSSLRRLTRQSARQLLGGVETLSVPGRGYKMTGILGGVSLAAGAGLVVWSLISRQAGAAGIFFGAGSLLLLGFLLLIRFLLQKQASAHHAKLLSVGALASRNTSRRAGRSTAVAAVLSCGVFLVAAVGLNQTSAPRDLTKPSGPTGGFTLMAETGTAVLKELKIDDPSLENSAVVSLRLREGEHAGCLNLNRASVPRILGVDPQAFITRQAFSFQSVMKGLSAASPWELLNADLGADVVPAIGDVGTVYWGLGLSVGDRLVQYDSGGRAFELRIVALMDNSVLQGNLVISEEQFIKRFESVAGYRVFLIDIDPKKADAAAAMLTHRMRDKGMEVVSTRQHLNELNAVENTYLVIFLVLGGLGLLLGTLGLGLVVWLNVMDRRSELAMMRAVGFSREQLVGMLRKEHTNLLAAGVFVGTVSAFVAVAPALRMLSSQTGLVTLAVLLAAICISGWLWIRLAAGMALSGELLDALRNE